MLREDYMSGVELVSMSFDLVIKIKLSGYGALRK